MGAGNHLYLRGILEVEFNVVCSLIGTDSISSIHFFRCSYGTEKSLFFTNSIFSCNTNPLFLPWKLHSFYFIAISNTQTKSHFDCWQMCFLEVCVNWALPCLTGKWPISSNTLPSWIAAGLLTSHHSIYGTLAPLIGSWSHPIPYTAVA